MQWFVYGECIKFYCAYRADTSRDSASTVTIHNALRVLIASTIS